MTTFSWKRTQPFTAPHPPKPSAAAIGVVLPENVICGSPEQRPRGPCHEHLHNCVLHRREAALSMLLEQFSRARRNCQTEHALWLLPVKCGREARTQHEGTVVSFRFGVSCSVFLSPAECWRFAAFPYASWKDIERSQSWFSCKKAHLADVAVDIDVDS